ncbi:hypothetical protein [Pseudoalteromonas sp. S16_S37]|uniref:hypothetical protein n=1 Tax=Pseudoalteromonas sp. S16_S37 TaxID=2720228 RepID=UPI001681AC90|nr:hypothetical protein [Pseudoalteromonas sp. S16_S37]MBD1584906.1 hypothetical protein [Pseudoalteromonas sp. S16_S37]
MARKLYLMKLPIGIAIAMSTKGFYFVGIPLALAYYLLTFKQINNSDEFTDRDKRLYKQAPFAVALAALGGGVDSMLLFGISCLYYLYFVLSID